AILVGDDERIGLLRLGGDLALELRLPRHAAPHPLFELRDRLVGKSRPRRHAEVVLAMAHRAEEEALAWLLDRDRGAELAAAKDRLTIRQPEPGLCPPLAAVAIEAVRFEDRIDLFAKPSRFG